MTAKPKIFRRKPSDAFSAMQFTGVAGNVNDILKWTQGKYTASFYRAAIPAQIVKNGWPPKMSDEVIEAIGIINPSEFPNTQWLELGGWLTYGHRGENKFYVMDNAPFNENYEEV